MPPTPSGELAKALRDIVDREAEAGVHFRIVETGGSSIKSQIQKSNPTTTVGCTDARCLPCKSGQGEGGDCRRCGITYQIECQLCPDESRSVYIGESSRNLFSRGKEHEERFKNKNNNSFMLKHQSRKHPGMEGKYTAKVTGSMPDCLTRQVKEAVLIRRCKTPILNSKTEWHQPALYQIQNEIYSG